MRIDQILAFETEYEWNEKKEEREREKMKQIFD